MRQVLSDHVTQKGSLVDPDRLRFDFSHPEPVTTAQLADIETIVNQEIRGNTVVASETMAIDDAKAAGAMALFGEKYGDRVRVITMGSTHTEPGTVGQDEQIFSLELCGGTHVNRTGDIGALWLLQKLVWLLE